MSPSTEGESILTLEPLVDAVRDGVEGVGWELSGLQKTTSHQFEGRWAGQSTRSAYVFFHHPSRWERGSVDVYLDETSEGLKGNLALVTDAPDLDELGDAGSALEALGSAAAEHLPPGYRTPVTLRLRLPDGGSSATEALLEIRFKLRIPATAIEAGGPAVSALASTTVKAFESLAEEPEIQRYLILD